MTGQAARAGVVFDLDGVLVLSEHLWEAAWRDHADRHGYAWTAEDTRRCQGMSVPEWGSYLATRTGTNERDAVQQVTAWVSAVYDRGGVPLVHGARQLVETIAAKAPVGLASSAPRRIIDTVMGSMGLGAWFTATVSSSEVPSGKPSPDVYLEAVRRMGVDARESIAVEDSSNGIRAASAAGLRVLAVPHAAYPVAPDALALVDSVHDSLDTVRERLMALLDAPPPLEDQR